MIKPLFRAVGCTALALGLLLALPFTASAGQTVIIDGKTVSLTVMGNSPNTNGEWNWPGPGQLGGSNNNTVIIRNGSIVENEVYGGYTDLATGNARASGNRVTIIGSTVEGDVYGGFADTSSGNATATHNTVTIMGNSTFDEVESILYGGFGTGIGCVTDVFTGNTLNVWNYRGSPVAGVENFEFFNFVFPVTQGDDPVLTVKGDAVLGDGAGRGSTVTASTIGGPPPLQPGATVVTLIDASLESAISLKNRPRACTGLPCAIAGRWARVTTW